MSRSFICPPAQTFHRLRKTAVLLAILTLVAALSSCGRNAAPADEIPPGQARSSTCAQRDQAALIALYNAAGGPDWHDNSNWLSQKPFSTWFGVTTASNGCVTRLDLQNNNLTGSIPPELGSLPMLQSLDLRNNNLGGPIPPELANASNLERLFLAPNNFTGCIPRQLARLDKFFPQQLFDRVRREFLFRPSPDRSDLGDVDLYYCVANPGLPINSALSAPSNLSYAYQGSSIVISWDPVDGADRYNLYHDNALDSSCRLSPSGKPKFCDYLATVLAETTYTHADPAGGRNYYWVIACNSSGCSPLDAENAASPPADTPYRPGLDYPPAPSNLTYAFEGSSVVINWDPADDADYYNLYHHDSFATYCHVQSDGSSSICDQLAANLVETTYTHAVTDRSNYYWVAACNNVGCSPVAEESPAKPAVDIPPAPSNLTYALEGPSIVLSWDPVDGADYYNLYHHRAFASSCGVRPDGSSMSCDQLAANLVETTYTHADPDRRNYYWVTACNRGGCSPVAEESPAKPAVDIPPTPAVDIPPTPSNLTFALEGSSVVINWDPVDDADYYNLYHHDSFATYCKVQSDGSSSFCDQLAANLVETTYTHAATDRSNYYWVAACNNVGCSPVEEESPAKPAVEIPPAPSNLTYALEGPSIILTWDPVDRADYYNLYHHRAFASYCEVRPDGSSFSCDQLAANLVETTYTHADPDRRNYYWVIACNRGGCSPVDVTNVASPVETGPADNDN